MSIQNKDKKNKNGIKNYFILSGFAMQMGVTIYVGAYLGKYLDAKFPADKKWFTILFTLLGVGISLYVLLKQLNKHQEE